MIVIAPRTRPIVAGRRGGVGPSGVEGDEGPAGPTGAAGPQGDEYNTKRQHYFDALKAVGATSKRALVVVMLGQSLATSRGTLTRARSWPGAKMPVGGVAMIDWKHSALNVEHSAHNDSVASFIDLQEGAGDRDTAGQSPAVGIAIAIAGSLWERAYIGGVAIGSRTVLALSGAGPRANLNALLHRAVKQARTDGYEPDIAFYSAHGEADAVAATSEANYYSQAADYYGMAQMFAAQALQKPDYAAPVFLTYPAQQAEGADDRNVKEAIRRVARDLPGGVDLGPIYQWALETDLVHPTPAAYVLRGEYVGLAIRNYFEEMRRGTKALEIVDVTLSGASVVIYFNNPVVRDTSIAVATALSGTDGFEWSDNGAAIAFTGALTYSGGTVSGTLASTPVGTIFQQVLRYGVQTNVPTAAVPANVAGGHVRANEAGRVSTVDPASTFYLWASPQTYDAVRAV